jgi:hypothetical protein
MTLHRALCSPLRRLARDERGVMSALNLFLTVAACAIGAAAVDVTHFYAARSQLQVGADLAAHAALYTRRYGKYESGTYYALTDDQAKTAAVNAVQYGMPASTFGAVVASTDIVLGRLDFTTGQVIADPVHPEAAQVLTHRTGSNPVGSFLFRLVGIDSMNVRTSAVFSLGPGECRMDQGFFSQTKVAINGGNTLYPGFCVGAPKFWVRNQNAFRPGVTTLIPNGSGLDLSGSDVNAHNPGLMESVQYGALDLATTLNLVKTDDSTLPAQYRSHAYAYQLLAQANWTQVVANRDVTPTPLTPGTYTPDQLTANGVYSVSCASTTTSTGSNNGQGGDNGKGGGNDKGGDSDSSTTGSTGNAGGTNNSLTLKDGTGGDTFRNVVILTDCAVNFDGSVKLEDMVLSSTYLSSNQPSIQAPASSKGLVVGKNDSCAPTGGAALITRGRVDVAAKVNFYGAQVRAGTEVDFQSNATGQGVSIIAGGQVATNSNAEMQGCGPQAGAFARNVSLRLVR